MLLAAAFHVVYMKWALCVLLSRAQHCRASRASDESGIALVCGVR